MATSLLHPDRIAKLIVADIAPIAYNQQTNPGWASVTNVVGHHKSLSVSYPHIHSFILVCIYLGWRQYLCIRIQIKTLAALDFTHIKDRSQADAMLAVSIAVRTRMVNVK